MKDSLYGIEKSKIVAELEAEYDSEKKEIAINQLEQQNTITQLQSQRKDILLATISSISILVIIAGFGLFGRYKTKKENEELNTRLVYEQNLNKSVLTSIKAQMNPHFFYNALNTIQSFIFTDDKRQATAYLSKFSALTRMILEMSEKERVPLNQEIKAITLYLEIEKARFDVDFNFTLTLHESVDGELISIPSMIIQPFIENSIKHGLLHKKEAKLLTINFTRNSECLFVTIDDNGIGREKSTELNKNRMDHQSFASKANETRLDLLNKGKAKKVSVTYIDKKDAELNSLGTTVTLEIPIN